MSKSIIREQYTWDRSTEVLSVEAWMSWMLDKGNIEERIKKMAGILSIVGTAYLEENMGKLEEFGDILDEDGRVREHKEEE